MGVVRGFDEIDTGISGEIAIKMAEMMREMAVVKTTANIEGRQE